MKELVERIKKEGVVISDTILKIDSFLNHQADPILMSKVGKKIASFFKDKGITKVVTIETSGIVPAIFTAYELRVPLVFARKRKPLTLSGRVYEKTITSRTKLNKVKVMLSGDFINENDKVLVVDDFLATGETIKALCEILEEAKAEIVGIAVCVEKTFQGGRKRLEGYNVKALALVDSLKPLVVRGE